MTASRRLMGARPAAVLLWLAAFAGAARGDPIVADLSSHIIAISTGFSGTSVVLFGATDGPGDIIAVVRGPEQKTTVWHKGKVAGIWVNTESVTFTNVPSFYFVAASRPLEEVLAPGPAALYRIGTGNLKLASSRPQKPDRLKRFTDALVEQQRTAGLFGDQVAKVSFLGERLFRTSISFPANVPTGTYLVEVFLVRDRDVISGQTTPLVVSKVGIDAAVSDFAARESAAYGVIAVLTAVMAGWLASLPFRSV